MESEAELKQLLKDNEPLAIELMKGLKMSPFEILQFRHKNNSVISEEAALEGGLLLNKNTLAKCIICGNDSFDCEVTETIANISCEETITCTKCNHVTMWLYGSLDFNNIS